MGADKLGSKSGGFFHLFDWNKKSRKKLFVSPEGSKQVRKFHNDLPATHLCLVDDDTGVSSVKASSDYSCASSVTDEEGNGVRAPGVVARLMGLDSLPTAGVSEPYSTPLFESQSYRDRRIQKRSPEFEASTQFINGPSRTEVYSRKPPELKRQKMPSSPIERFQMEILPPRSAKSLPISHCKLLSPIKNPRFISSEDAAHIMEAAAKILQPGLHTNYSVRTQTGSCSIPLRVKEPKVSIAPPQRTSMVLDSHTKPVETNALKYLRGQPFNRSWNGSESEISYKSSPNWDYSCSSAKSKGKSLSLAIQAKVNVQKREGKLVSGRKSFNLNEQQDGLKQSQQNRNEPSTQRNKMQKRTSSSSASGVLKQNNQKQNCLLNKERLSVRPSGSNQHSRKAISGATSSGRTKVLNKIQGNPKHTEGKVSSRTVVADKEASTSRSDNFPRKKRTIDGDCRFEKSKFNENVPVGRLEKCFQSNVHIDENLKWSEENRKNGMDVVSFTFSSPIVKPIGGSQFSMEKMEKRVGRDDDNEFNAEKNTADSKILTFSTPKLNGIRGDDLSTFLEQKLMELKLELEPSQFKDLKTSDSTSTSVTLHDLVSDTAAAAQLEDEKVLSSRSNDYSLISGSDSGSFAINAQRFTMGIEMQVTKDSEGTSNSSFIHKDPEHQLISPFSVLEASFSGESYNTSGSCDSIHGIHACSSIQAQCDGGFSIRKEVSPMETETELSDSACSCLESTAGDEHTQISITGCTKLFSDESKYLREILSAEELNLIESGFFFGTGASDALFGRLERNKGLPRSMEYGSGRLRRKLFFDCVIECLTLKCSAFFLAGYKSWAKGVMVIRRREFADEIHNEISGWECMRDWMVDELVDKDMSCCVGRWTDFEIDAFETGVQVVDKILGSLIDELVVELSIH